MKPRSPSTLVVLQTLRVADKTETAYARSRDGYVAYQVSGTGAADVLLRSFGTISVESFEREPHFAGFLERVGRFARVIRYDARGVGLSDPIDPSAPPTLEEEVADALAVLDAAGSERALIVSLIWDGPQALLFAATHPDRTTGLVLCNAYARVTSAPDYPFGIEPDAVAQRIESVTEPGTEFDAARAHAPSLGDDEVFRTWWTEEGRRGASPRTARMLLRTWFFADARGTLPSIHAPTIVVQRRLEPEDPYRYGRSRYLAGNIAGARFVELHGTDLFPFSDGGLDVIVGEIEELLTGARRESDPSRVLATVLFTDIVSSTDQAAALGDRRWREHLDRHDAMVRRQFERFGGKEIKTTGDGFVATFDGPARGVRCGLAIRDGAAQLGIGVRVGLHTGEIELRGDDILGIAVHLAQRVSATAGAGEVLVSRTVKDLVFGSELAFRDHGSHELKGLPDRWELFEVEGA